MVTSGAAGILNDAGFWAVPAGCGGWIPAATRHAIEPTPRARVRTLYIYGANTGFRRTCATVEMAPLLRAIVDHTALAGISGEPGLARHQRLIAVMFDQLAAARERPLYVPSLKTPLAQRVAVALRSDPADTPRIRDLAAELGVSDRTLERAFRADAAMTLGEWRQRSRISRAIRLLAGGGDVKDVALEVGYATPSAFVAAFKKYVGTTPGRITNDK